jgi:hypothetical protein
LESNDHEPLHVLIQGNTEEDVQKAAELIEPLINSYGASRITGAVMLREAVGAVLHDEFCENCYARDHKWWNCPHKLGEGHKKNEVFCENCHERSHPTYDCPFIRRKLFLLPIAGANSTGEITLKEEFNRFMRELKGPDWVDSGVQPRALKAAEELRALEYGGTAGDASIEALGQNVTMNQFVKTKQTESAPLAIKEAPENKIETTFKGSNVEIKVEDVIFMDSNGNYAGTMAPEGSVTNPLMNPMSAALYAPHIIAYNSMIQNPEMYYASYPQGNSYCKILGGINSSLAGFPLASPDTQGE